jgi:hypothetical protein
MGKMLGEKMLDLNKVYIHLWNGANKTIDSKGSGLTGGINNWLGANVFKSKNETIKNLEVH